MSCTKVSDSKILILCDKSKYNCTNKILKLLNGTIILYVNNVLVLIKAKYSYQKLKWQNVSLIRLRW